MPLSKTEQDRDREIADLITAVATKGPREVIEKCVQLLTALILTIPDPVRAGQFMRLSRELLRLIS